MTRRELNLAIFEHTNNAVLWQPRLETWFWHHEKKHTLPTRFESIVPLGPLDGWLPFYDLLHCSVRYHHVTWGSLEMYYEQPDEILVAEQEDGEHFIVTLTTPAGMLRTIYRDAFNEKGERINRRIEKYPVTTPEELLIVANLMERRNYRANNDFYAEKSALLGDRGEPTIWINSSGFTELIKEWCGLENTFYLWADDPDAVDAYMDACERRDDRQVEAALQTPCRLFNLGDHATNEFTPPVIMERYMLPHWQRISSRLHEENRFVHSHWDGNAKSLLPYLRDTGFDAVEALTPDPQGDITLEEIKAAVGDDIICLDLIPAIHFMPQYSLEEVLDFTRKTIDLFAPRLILGISDEISEVGEIEKVEAITELVECLCGLPEQVEAAPAAAETATR